MRPPLTTTALQAKHADVFRRLFQKCSIVVSVPLITSLSGDRSLTERHAVILLHLPRRLYLGLEYQGGRPASPGAMLEYDTLAEYFADAPATMYERLAKLLNGFEESLSGYLVHVVAEGMDGRSLAVPAALGAALAYAESIVREAAATKVCMDMPQAERLRDACFKSILSSAQSGQKVLRPGYVTGLSPASVLLSEHVTCLADVGGEVRAYAQEALLRPISEWPVDITHISTGIRNDLGREPELFCADAQNLRYLKSLHLSIGVSPLTGPVSDSRIAVRSLRDAAFLDILRGWSDLWSQKSVEYSTSALLDAFRRREALLYATERTHPAITQTLSVLRGVLGRGRYGAFPMGTGGHGGAVLLLTPAGEERASLPEILQEMHAGGLGEAAIEFCSWIDTGFASGPRLEQDLRNGVSSPYLPKAACKFTRYSDGLTSTTFRSTGSGGVDADLVIDAVQMRVSIAGQNVDSHVLVSQRMTVELLRRVLSAASLRVGNEELPRSSYRSSRAECVAKLISPLVRAVSMRTGKNLVLRTHGSTSIFTVEAELGTVSCLLIEPIGRATGIRVTA